jgi:hypothetical protein
LASLIVSDELGDVIGQNNKLASLIVRDELGDVIG